jgi:hypothetical protein
VSKSSEALLWYSLILILILVAIPFSFVFIINWEDWIFGIKLDGWPAGIALLAKAVTAFTLAVLLIWFPKYKKGLSLLTIDILGFYWLIPQQLSRRIPQERNRSQSFSCSFSSYRSCI